MNTVGWARYMERRRVGMCACTLISCYCYYGYREILKQNIFRVLRLIIGLCGFASIALTSNSMLPISIEKSSIVLSAIACVLFTVGGSKLLPKLPFTSLLNEKVSTVFNTGRTTVK